MNSAEELKKLVEESRVAADTVQLGQLLGYLDLLKKWNSRINLTASTEWTALEPLFREGFWAAGLYPGKAGTHLDIGSGAGFPAAIIAILKPQVQMDLVEGRMKKCVFLETLANTLGLERLRVHALRLQDFLQRNGHDRTWDCISWKALKLRSGELTELRAHAHGETQIWMFHGKDPAVEEPDAMERHFRMSKREQFEGKRVWALSIYVPR